MSRALSNICQSDTGFEFQADRGVAELMRVEVRKSMRFVEVVEPASNCINLEMLSEECRRCKDCLTVNLQ